MRMNIVFLVCIVKMYCNWIAISPASLFVVTDWKSVRLQSETSKSHKINHPQLIKLVMLGVDMAAFRVSPTRARAGG